MSVLVSIIIPTLNRRKLVSDCILSILRQSLKDYEIIVVDDGSSDGTEEHLKNTFPMARVIRHPRPLGPAYSRNAGSIHASGKHLYFLDSDVELPHSRVLEEMIRVMERSPDVDVAGGVASFGADGNPKELYGKFVTFDGRSYVKNISIHPHQSDGVHDCHYIETCNCLIRRSRFFKIGGFDPYYVYMGEDKELGEKVIRSGGRCVISPKFAAIHRYAEDSAFDRRKMYLQTKMRYAIKNRGVLFFFLVPFLDIFLYFLYYPALFILKKLTRLVGARTINHALSPNYKAPRFRWLVQAPFHFLSAYWWNLRHLRKTLQCRGANFLEADEMNRFHQFRMGQRA